MPKYIILGAGRQGVAAAYDLMHSGGEVTVADSRPKAVDAACEKLGLPRDRGVVIDFTDQKSVASYLAESDAAFFAADYSLNERLTRWAIENQCHACDFGGNHDVVAAQHRLHDEAVRAGVTIVPDTGLTPGLAGILVAGGIGKLDVASSANIRVGGLPQDPKPPLNYTLLFSVRGLTNEYLEPSVVMSKGRKETRPSMEGLEWITIDGREYEAFYTSGGVSTLPESFGQQLQSLDCKTIRYPGHAELIKFAFDIGFRSEETVEIDGVPVVPRKVFEEMLIRTLPHDEPDVTLMRVTVKGKKNGKPTIVTYEMIDRFDEATGFTSMQRTTAWPGSSILHLVATGAVAEKGVLYQEKVVECDSLVRILGEKGIEIRVKMEEA